MGAIFRGAIFLGGIFRVAIFQVAIFRGAIFSEVIFLEPVQRVLKKVACTKPYHFDVADDSRVCYVEKDFSSQGDLQKSIRWSAMFTL